MTSSFSRDVFVKHPFLYPWCVTIFQWLTRVTLILFIIGSLHDPPIQFANFNFVVKLIVGFFLIYRFNNFFSSSRIVFTELDRTACYSAGVYIVLISCTDLATYYIEAIRAYIFGDGASGTKGIAFPFLFEGSEPMLID